MKYKLLGGLLIVSLLASLFLFMKKEKFDYVSLEIRGETVECKYVLFAEPIKMHRIDVFKEYIEDINLVPQWVKFAQYQTYDKSVFFETFPRDLYAEGYPERTALIESKYEEDVSRGNETIKVLVEHLDENELTGEIKGLLFVRIDGLEIVIFKYEYLKDGSPYHLGSQGVFREGKLVVLDPEIFNFDRELLVKCFGANDEDLIKGLRASSEGLIELEGSPFSWHIPAH